MALAILILLPAFPFSATFLTPREKSIAQARVNSDHKPTSHGGMTGWEGFKAVVGDPNAWLLMLIYASCKSLPSSRLSIPRLTRFANSQRRSSHRFVLLAYPDQGSGILLYHCARDDRSTLCRRLVYGILPSDALGQDQGQRMAYHGVYGRCVHWIRYSCH